MSELMKSIGENLGFVLEILAVIVVLFIIASILEKVAQKKQNIKEPVFTTRKVAVIGVFSAISTILMLLEIPLFFVPGMYKLDFSEVPILISSFAFGPATGVMMEFLKNLLKLLFKPTSTAFIGELANFAVGCSFILPASTIYAFKKSKKNAIAACVVSTLVLTVFGTAFNAIYLLPAFAKYYGMPLETIINMGVEINPFVSEGSIVSFVVACVAPLNLLKGTLVSIMTMVIYKPLSKVIKSSGQGR